MDENTGSPAPVKKSNTGAIIVGVLVVLLLAGGGYYLATKNTGPTPAPQTTTQVTPTSGAMEGMSPTSMSGTAAMKPTGEMKGPVKEISVSAKNYSFTPSTITVKKGDVVKVTFTSTGGFHNWGIDEYNVRTNSVQTGASDTVQFVADKAGTFEYYCSIGNHRQLGMVGKLIVQ